MSSLMENMSMSCGRSIRGGADEEDGDQEIEEGHSVHVRT
jgi:hypothetical protein